MFLPQLAHTLPFLNITSFRISDGEGDGDAFGFEEGYDDGRGVEVEDAVGGTVRDVAEFPERRDNANSER